MIPKFHLRPRNNGRPLVSWNDESAAGHALFHDQAHAEEFADANLPGFVSDAARFYLAHLGIQQLPEQLELEFA